MVEAVQVEHRIPARLEGGGGGQRVGCANAQDPGGNIRGARIRVRTGERDRVKALFGQAVGAGNDALNVE